MPFPNSPVTIYGLVFAKISRGFSEQSAVKDTGKCHIILSSIVLRTDSRTCIAGVVLFV